MPSLKPSIGNKQQISLDDVCYLILSTIEEDELSQEIEIDGEPRQVFCSVLNIERNEFAVTFKNGLKAKMVIVVDYDEYDYEEKLKYNNQIFDVYRPFVRNDGYIELYCEVRTGGN